MDTAVVPRERSWDFSYLIFKQKTSPTNQTNSQPTAAKTTKEESKSTETQETINNSREQQEEFNTNNNKDSTKSLKQPEKEENSFRWWNPWTWF